MNSIKLVCVFLLFLLSLLEGVFANQKNNCPQMLNPSPSEQQQKTSPHQPTESFIQYIEYLEAQNIIHPSDLKTFHQQLQAPMPTYALLINNAKTIANPTALFHQHMLQTYYNDKLDNQRLLEWLQNKSNKKQSHPHMPSMNNTPQPSHNDQSHSDKSRSDQSRSDQSHSDSSANDQSQPFKTADECSLCDLEPPTDRMHLEHTPLNNSSDPDENLTVLGYTNIKTLYFLDKAYFYLDDVNKMGASYSTAAVFEHKPAPAWQLTPAQLTLNTQNTPPNKAVNLLLPVGYRPLQPKKGAQVVRLATGEYKLILSEYQPLITLPLLKEFEYTPDEESAENKHHTIDLQEAKALKKSLAQEKKLISKITSSKVALDLKLLPQDMQEKIKTLKSQKLSPVEVASQLAQYIKSNFKYNGADNEAHLINPIEALKQGRFQCDTAAYIMVALLRQAFHIKARISTGLLAYQDQHQKDSKSYIVFNPSIPGHAWVDVWHNETWHSFDPTPSSSPHSDDSTAPSRYTPIADPLSRSSFNFKPHSKQDNSENNNEDTTEDTNEDTTNTPPPQESFNLNIGQLNSHSNHPLVHRALRLLLQFILNPNQSGQKTENQLHQIGSLTHNFSPRSSYQKIYHMALNTHKGGHPKLTAWLELLNRTAQQGHVTKTYQHLHKLIMSLTLYSQTLDSHHKPPHTLLNLLHEAQQQVKSLAHPRHHDIGVVNSLFTDLPPVARRILNIDYGLDQVGDNAATFKVAQKLKASRLRHLQLVATLAPLTNFILNSTTRPENIKIKTWQVQHPIGKDFLPLKRFSDLPRSVFMQPHKSVQHNIQDQTAFVPYARKSTEIPRQYGTRDDDERLSIILYDTSGSMNGAPAQFQAALIAAFTARALSDVSPLGRQRHRVFIVPFDSITHKPTFVQNASQALDIVRHYKQRFSNTMGGTDIQLALLDAMNLIAQAQKTHKNKALAAAHIILMTDGQADINIRELQAARRQIHKNTKLQIMFVAIHESNPELMQFAMQSKASGIERSFYREFEESYIKNLIQQSQQLIVEDSHFYPQPGAQLPASVLQLIEQAYHEAVNYSTPTQQNPQDSADQLLAHIKSQTLFSFNNIKQASKVDFMSLRLLMAHPVFNDKKLAQLVLNDIIHNFYNITQLQLEQLSPIDQEHLKALISQTL